MIAANNGYVLAFDNLSGFAQLALPTTSRCASSPILQVTMSGKEAQAGPKILITVRDATWSRVTNARVRLRATQPAGEGTVGWTAACAVDACAKAK
jgi:hypothetical protein